ncbi:hypothetical protein [Kibdelosporangium philippinense]
MSRLGVSRGEVVVLGGRPVTSNLSHQVDEWSPNDTQKIGSISSR